MTITVQGGNINKDRALQIATERFQDNSNRKQKPGFYFDRFCLDYAVSIIDHENLTFLSTPEFISEVRDIVVAAHDQLDTDRAVTWQGKNGHTALSTIPNNHRAAVRNLIDNNDPAPGHDRGAHATNPSTGAAGAYREFDLTAAADGRATRLTRGGGKRAIYYSSHHAYGTYRYALVTDAHGRPFLRGYPAVAEAGRAARLKVPLP